MGPKQRRSNREQGNTMLEFAVVAGFFLMPLLLGSFTIGMTLAKGIQVSNVCREGAVLFVRATTDPAGGLDLSLPSNQSMIVHAAAGLGMNQPGTNLPDPNGKGAVILSKVIRVGDAECSAGVVPAPVGAPPWNAGNCPNYDSYVFTNRIIIGNGSRFSSLLGDPPTGTVKSDGSISAKDIATNTANRAQRFGPGGMVTLIRSTFALTSEMYVDVSQLNLFSILAKPVIYCRNIS